MQSTQLKQAISDDNRATVSECLNSRTVNKKYANGSMPLSHAAGLGRVAIVAQLLGQGAKPDVRDDNYNTPLALAVIAGHADVVELLLPHMSQAQIQVSVNGKTAHEVAQETRARIEKRLAEDPTNEHAKQQLQKYTHILKLFDAHKNNGVPAAGLPSVALA